MLIPGSLRDNLLYGCPAGRDGPRRAASPRPWRSPGSIRLIHARGLAGTLDPHREPKLAAAIVESRRAVQAALVAEGLDRFVDPFDADALQPPCHDRRKPPVREADRRHLPRGQSRLAPVRPRHPRGRGPDQAAGRGSGFSIATSMIEIFADIPDGHPLFERFSFFSASDRPYFEDLVERRSRAPARRRDRPRPGAPDRPRAALQREPASPRPPRRRIARDGSLAARADFARMLPCQPAAGDRILRRGAPLRRRRACRTTSCSAASLRPGRRRGGGPRGHPARPDRSRPRRRGLADRPRQRRSTRSGGDLTLERDRRDRSRALPRAPARHPGRRARPRRSARTTPPTRLVGALAPRARRSRPCPRDVRSFIRRWTSPPFDAVIRFERGTSTATDRRVRRAEPVPA